MAHIAVVKEVVAVSEVAEVVAAVVTQVVEVVRVVFSDRSIEQLPEKYVVLTLDFLYEREKVKNSNI